MTNELFREHAFLQDIEATVVALDDGAVICDQTNFYAMGGGQPGDSGSLFFEDGSAIKIVDTRKTNTGDIAHLVEEKVDLPAIGAKVRLVLDWERRHRLMRVHTALHLLCSQVDAGVTGGSIGEEKGRLDFDLEEPPEKEALEQRLNQIIAEDHPVSHSWITDEELEANPNLVRTMSVKPPMGSGKVRVIRIGTEENTVDFQPCGGTHVKSTAEIGAVRIGKIEKKGRQNRRVNLHLV